MNPFDAAKHPTALAADARTGQAPHGPTVVEPAEHRASAYVEQGGVSLQHFVNRYIRTRRRPVNRENRLIVQEAMRGYAGRYPARAADLEAFLDSILLVADAR